MWVIAPGRTVRFQNGHRGPERPLRRSWAVQGSIGEGEPIRAILAPVLGFERPHHKRHTGPFTLVLSRQHFGHLLGTFRGGQLVPYVISETPSLGRRLVANGNGPLLWLTYWERPASA